MVLPVEYIASTSPGVSNAEKITGIIPPLEENIPPKPGIPLSSIYGSIENKLGLPKSVNMNSTSWISVSFDNGSPS